MNEVDFKNLKNLYTLKQKNILSKTEYQTAKEKILKSFHRVEQGKIENKQDFFGENMRLLVNVFCLVFLTVTSFGTRLMEYFPFVRYEIWFLLAIGVLVMGTAVRLLTKKDGPLIVPIMALIFLGSCFYWQITYLFS
ncbi:hypothetical protein FAI41_07715 [Acetobacteraceae bacterium]|nr:hypothetical protein FAI41_07715 [Acetobacteraceae bacterium]